MISAFLSWFISILLWLLTTVGGWLVYFDFASVHIMLLASVVISALVAAYWTVSEKF